MRKIVREIQHALKRHIEIKYREGAKRYVKEGIILHGVRSKTVRDTAAKYFRRVKTLSKREIFNLCEDLLKTDFSEERTIAFEWAFRIRKKYDQSDFQVFESWMKKYVRNWGACDDFCRHAFGAFILQFPNFIPKLNVWTGSKNRWFKRGAAVVLISSVRVGKNLKAALDISDRLLTDQDYLVQNGYGWLLKDASILYAKQVFDFVNERKSVMPRRALRYAIERYSARQRKQLMVVHSTDR